MQDAEGLVAVKTVTIDSIVDEDIQLLKIDVEGCELRAVRAFPFSTACLFVH